jgi:vancomycin permeability regulator SanA
MKRLFSFIFQLIAAAILVFIGTAAWIIFDGVSDTGDKADVALFSGHTGEAIDAQLDHVVKLYKDGVVPAVIVTEPAVPDSQELATTATKYLEAHGVPSSAILEDRDYIDTWDMAHKAANTMKIYHYASVMLVTDYYRITRLKIALNHEGVGEIHKSHLGQAQVGDVVAIGREVVALYDYVGRTFLLPAAEKIRQEAKVGADKAKEDAQKAKDRINKDLDSLPK